MENEVGEGDRNWEREVNEGERDEVDDWKWTVMDEGSSWATVASDGDMLRETEREGTRDELGMSVVTVEWWLVADEGGCLILIVEETLQ